MHIITIVIIITVNETSIEATELVNVSATKLDEPSNTQVTDTIEQEEQEEDEDNTVRCPCEYNEVKLTWSLPS